MFSPPFDQEGFRLCLIQDFKLLESVFSYRSEAVKTHPLQTTLFLEFRGMSFLKDPSLYKYNSFNWNPEIIILFPISPAVFSVEGIGSRVSVFHCLLTRSNDSQLSNIELFSPPNT